MIIEIYKKILLFNLLFILTISVSAEEKILLKKKIDWHETSLMTILGEEKEVLSFSNNGYTNEIGLPIIIETINIPANIDLSTLKISISDASYKWPTPEEHLAIKDIVEKDSIAISYKVSTSRNINNLDISIIPVRRNPNEPTFKKLHQYTLNINFDTLSDANLKGASNVSTFTNNSVLKDGKWVKVKIKDSGIHKISYTELKNMGFSNPDKVSVYGNGGRMLAKLNSDFRHEDLAENAIWHHNNAIYFYAEGTKYWNYNDTKKIIEHEIHDFTEDAIYFLTDKNSTIKSVTNSDEQGGSATVNVDYFNDYKFFETNEQNLIKSGRIWFGERFSTYSTLSYDYTFSFDNLITNEDVIVYTQLAARSETTSTFTINHNSNLLTTVSIPEIIPNKTEWYFAQLKNSEVSFSPGDNNFTITLQYNGTSSSIGYLDYIGVNAKRKLIQSGSQMIFRNIDIVSNNQIANYTLGNINADFKIWDITDPSNCKLVNHTLNGSNASFNYNANSIKEFISFNPSQSYPSVTFVENVENQNLHNSTPVDYIIVTHEDFIDQAERLASIHQEHNNLTTLVVTPEKIYNEFSSGQPDVSAIRDFVKSLYEKAGDNTDLLPKYLLLFGDGSYDNRSTTDNTNKIITYQSDESLHQSNSFVSDDFFGFLDPNEGENIQNNKLDIGIGRFPVNTIEEATNAVDRSEKYITSQKLSPWKTQVSFVADDGDENTHMSDADFINETLSNKHPEINVNKIYFDAYPRVSTSSGNRYPEVEEEINNCIQQGTLIFNYTGHGGTNGLAEERVVTKESISSWTNINSLPLFVTATCEFSRFDNKLETSAGEMVFLSPVGGGIALFTTTRIAYTGSNKTISLNFYNNVLEKDENNKKLRFGEIIRRTKNDCSAGVYKLNFTLLGDPALELIYPDFNVKSTKINDILISDTVKTDTLKALSLNKLEGSITTNKSSENTVINNFDGELNLTIYDKKQFVNCLGQNSDTIFSFEIQKSTIYKGRSSVNQGQFQSEFIIPKDIKYNYDYGKISYYASSGDHEAYGAFNDIIIGGMNENPIDDNEGPDINVFLNKRSFKSGDETTPAPLLIVDLFDKSGINTTGTGIGHDITYVINEISPIPTVLNNYYVGKIDSYQEGSIECNLPQMEIGEYTLTVKAWDSFNNSNEKTISFKVGKNIKIDFNNHKVYPNPIVSGADAYFSFEHDEPNLSLSVEVNIHTLSGELLSKQRKNVVSLGNTIPPIHWKANYSNGKPLSAGVYIYQLRVKSETGRVGNLSGKIMITQ
ncbi:type IX secretion system sortase PorU [Saccharicrinis aurantiacus]|uniref:type IX secretion system sortase PorU n=1 Tax=Saccharicrinis aurantiacus TaxID=1849719 RepID=UPI00094F5218|nr:type IX secretion system sortase PorU [Saccharicrinis aurantiacus]